MSIAKDPVCGMEVDEKTAPYKLIQGSSVYYFHSAECQNEFSKNPEKYVKDSMVRRHAGHYGAYCPTPGCGKPTRGLSWYLYIGLVALLLFTVLVTFLLH